MNRIIWLFVGLLLGAGGMWAYATQVREPQLIAQTEQNTKQSISEETLAHQAIITGTLVGIDGTDITVRIAHNIGEESLAVITTDTNTAIYQIKNDEAATKEKVGLTALPLDSLVTITLDSVKAKENSLYAKEITKI